MTPKKSLQEPKRSQIQTTLIIFKICSKITKNWKVPKKRGGTALMGPMCAPIHIILYPSAHLETVEHFLDTNDDQECIELEF